MLQRAAEKVARSRSAPVLCTNMIEDEANEKKEKRGKKAPEGAREQREGKEGASEPGLCPQWQAIEDFPAPPSTALSSDTIESVS